LSAIPDVDIVGLSESADEAITQIVAAAPDAIIVDLLLQSGTGTTCWKASRYRESFRLSIVPHQLHDGARTRGAPRDWAPLTSSTRARRYRACCD
jgi:DNA-binding NarL/FixJ family response regulator